MSILILILGTLIGICLMAIVKAGTIKEKDSLIVESRSRLKEAEIAAEGINERNKGLTQNIRNKQSQIENLKQIINEVEELATCNKYNNEKAVIGKIIEVIQSAKQNNF